MAHRMPGPPEHVYLAQPPQFYSMAPPSPPMMTRRTSLPAEMQVAPLMVMDRRHSGGPHVPAGAGGASKMGRRTSAEAFAPASQGPRGRQTPPGVMSVDQAVALMSIGAPSPPAPGSPGAQRRALGMTVPHTIDNFLAQQGLERKRMPQDATCMYRAVADQIHLSSSLFGPLRQAVWTFIAEHQSLYEGNLADGVSFDEFMHSLREERVWGTLIEIDALAHVVRRDIMIYYAPDKPPFNQSAQNYTEHIFLTATHMPSGGPPHFDGVMPKKWTNAAAYCQSLLYEILGNALGCEFTKELEETRRGYRNLAIDSSSRRSSGQGSPSQVRRRSREKDAAGAPKGAEAHASVSAVLAAQFDPSRPGARLQQGDKRGAEMTAVRHAGRVKFFNCQKGYGFVVPNDGGDDIFVHHTAIVASDNGNKSLCDKDEVEFLLVPGPKGPQASHVTAVGGGPVRGGDPVTATPSAGPLSTAPPGVMTLPPSAARAAAPAASQGALTAPYYMQPQYLIPQPAYQAGPGVYYHYLPAGYAPHDYYFSMYDGIYAMPYMGNPHVGSPQMMAVYPPGAAPPTHASANATADALAASTATATASPS